MTEENCFNHQQYRSQCFASLTIIEEEITAEAQLSAAQHTKIHSCSCYHNLNIMYDEQVWWYRGGGWQWQGRCQQC